MKGNKRSELIRSNSSHNKFLTLLNQNRINDLQRKRLLEPKSKPIRKTQSLSTNNLPSAWRTVKHDKADDNIERVSKAFYQLEHQEPLEIVDLNDDRAKFRIHTKDIRDKISEKLLKNKRSLLLLHNAKKQDHKSLKKAPSFYIRTDAVSKNFCDFYAFTQSNWTDGQGKENRIPQMYHSRRRSQNPFEHKGSSKLSPAKKRQLESGKKQFTSADSSQKRLSHRIKSVFSKKSFIPKLQQGSDVPMKLNMRDSCFLRKYFKLKNDLLENREESMMIKEKLVEEMSKFIKDNYKSYWMSSIEDLLAQDVIEHIRFGYYRYKSINFGPFKLMSDVEKMIFRVQEDINKERMILFAGDKIKLSES